MMIHIIYPDWGFFPLVYRRYIPVMGPAVIAALTPSEIEVVFTDERLQMIDYDMDCDLVAISMMTSQANRAYEIAKKYREKGIPVVLGGVHVSLMPEEAIQHADTIVIGEAEGVWPVLINDFLEGHMKKVYSCNRYCDNTPFPRWDIFNKGVYLPMNSVQVARGCPVNCETCSVPLTYGREFRMTDVNKMLDNISKMEKYIFVINDNLHIAKRRVKKFLNGLAETGRQWVGLAPLSIANDNEFLSLLQKSRCWAMYVDISPWISAGLNKKISQNQLKQTGIMIEKIREKGIKIIASFVFGFDHDRTDIFENTVRFAKDNNIEEAEFHILTPYPKSRLFERLNTEGRLITKDFSKYSTSSVVFRPLHMSPEELYNGYVQTWKEFYPPESFEMTDKGPVVRTSACFPIERETLLNLNGVKWVDAIMNRYKEY